MTLFDLFALASRLALITVVLAAWSLRADENVASAKARKQFRLGDGRSAIVEGRDVVLVTATGHFDRVLRLELPELVVCGDEDLRIDSVALHQGRLLVAGVIKSGTHSEVPLKDYAFVARFGLQGGIDRSFGIYDGWTAFRGGALKVTDVNSLSSQDDGKILARWNSGGSRWTARLSPAGTIDTAFALGR